MSKQTYYTAVGHFKRRINSHGQSYPVIIINQMEYCVDIQEMALWTALNWRLLDLSQIEAEYHKLDQDCAIPALRTLEDCLGRLCTRGLVASGTGATDFEALYDLLGGLYVVPLSESLPLRVAAFLKLTVLRGIPVAKARELFRRDRPSEQEAQVMALSRQALLSTAELIKCAELGVRDVSTDEKLMDVLYNDDTTTSDNIPDMMLVAKSREYVTAAVANLYLRKQIIFQRV
ncbi:MAG: hypothetical protein HFF42_00225 [Lawsonibacter sp.]|nr:hypothetical protein [Lawsonibacter sp.]